MARSFLTAKARASLLKMQALRGIGCGFSLLIVISQACAEQRLEFKSFRLGMTPVEAQRTTPMKCTKPEPTLKSATCGGDKEMARQLRDLSALQHADRICDISNQTLVGYPIHLTRLSFFGEALTRIDLDLRFAPQKGNDEKVVEIIDALSAKYGKSGHVDVPLGIRNYITDTWRTSEGEIKLEIRGLIHTPGSRLHYAVPIYIESKVHGKISSERTVALNALSADCSRKSYAKMKEAAAVRAKDL